jgi:hypothetical protein
MCAIGKQATVLKREIAFIIKWNPRTTPVETIAKHKTADVSIVWVTLREGKRQCCEWLSRNAVFWLRGTVVPMQRATLASEGLFQPEIFPLTRGCLGHCRSLALAASRPAMPFLP